MENNLPAIKKIEKLIGIEKFRVMGENESRRYGTSLKGYIETRFCDLEAAFGAPSESDGYKVSGEWAFKDELGNEFTIYDWKCTNLYDADLPTVSELRNSKQSMQFNIGGDKGDTAAFIEWLESKLQGSSGRVGY